jgi:uncharacterized protein
VCGCTHLVASAELSLSVLPRDASMPRGMENSNPPPPSSPDHFSSTPSPSPAPPNASAARQWCMWCHLSALSGLLIPFGNVLGPLILWQMKRNEFPEVDYHGKEALNFQISVLIYVMVSVAAMFIGMLACVGWLLIPVPIAIGFGAMVLSIIAGIKANEGVAYRYPLTLRLIN